MLPLKAMIGLGVSLLFLAIITTVGLKVKGHFDHIAKVEAQNESLKENFDKMSGAFNKMKAANETNRKAWEFRVSLQGDMSRIGNEESVLEGNRNNYYRKIRDAALRSKTSSCPVDPVIIDTVNRLWKSDPNAGGAGNHSR